MMTEQEIDTRGLELWLAMKRNDAKGVERSAKCMNDRQLGEILLQALVHAAHDVRDHPLLYPWHLVAFGLGGAIAMEIIGWALRWFSR